ncbi:MAG: beta-glucosidase, partial [Bacteroidetes bacterium]
MTPRLQFWFNAPVDKTTAAAAIAFSGDAGAAVNFALAFLQGDSSFTIQPSQPLFGLTAYEISISRLLKSAAGALLTSAATVTLKTGIDSTDKFPRITDDALLTLVQRQTFTYFWDFAHPNSGMARERNTSGDLVTTGGTGFGIMGIVTGIHRGFISRQQGLDRTARIVNFLTTQAPRFKGAFPHWINGNTGAVIPFSANDNGADLVETSLLAMGLITARQYFDGADAAEVALRNSINAIVNGIEWNWFRKGNEQVLYWHWSPDKGWAMNLKIGGWNECLITYVLAAASSNFGISDTVYHKGYARDGAMGNGKTFYNTRLPLGPDFGGPLFLSHYSFMGINPNGLNDQYANYWTQQVAHSTINFEYCKANPRAQQGYSAACWGLTASDIPGGYTASSPANDV